MRQDYEDPQTHLERHMDRAAETYRDGLQKAGLAPNAILTKAMAERALRQAWESYIQQATDIRDRNIDAILREHTARMNVIKRQGSRLRLMTCPPITLFRGIGSWYSFTHTGVMMGMVYAGGALAYLAMLILGAIFDRPE